MGIFDVFANGARTLAGQGGSNPPATTDTPGPPEQESGLARTATGLVERLLDIGIDGRGPFDSATEVARGAISKTTSSDAAVDKIIADHLRLVAAGGFATGLGGFITLPVALPVNVSSFYILTTRAAASVASVRGYDLEQQGVRSAVLLSLVGADAKDLLTKVGYTTTGRLANLAAQRLPGPVMMAVNKAVGFRIVTQVGKSTFGRLGRGVPVAGGAIGAGLDAYLYKQITDHVREQFPDRRTLSLVP